jgi:hypothetical protein
VVEIKSMFQNYPENLLTDCFYDFLFRKFCVDQECSERDPFVFEFLRHNSVVMMTFLELKVKVSSEDNPIMAINVQNTDKQINKRNQSPLLFKQSFVSNSSYAT